MLNVVNLPGHLNDVIPGKHEAQRPAENSSQPLHRPSVLSPRRR